MKNRFYIRATGALPETHYWMQGPRKWTTSPFSATLFDTEGQAMAELLNAGTAAEVCLQQLPASKTIQHDGPLTRLRKANARSNA